MVQPVSLPLQLQLKNGLQSYFSWKYKNSSNLVFGSAAVSFKVEETY